MLKALERAKAQATQAYEFVPNSYTYHAYVSCLNAHKIVALVRLVWRGWRPREQARVPRRRQPAGLAGIRARNQGAIEVTLALLRGDKGAA